MAFPSSVCPSKSFVNNSTTCARWVLSRDRRSSWPLRSRSTNSCRRRGYDAVYIGTGAGLPQFMGIPGEHFNGVYSANEFLTRINLMKAYKFPTYDEPMVELHGKRCCRDRRRQHGAGRDSLGAAPGRAQAYVIYRRSDAEMPARAEEVHHARQEGIDFQMLTAPTEFLSDGKGWLTAARAFAWNSANQMLGTQAADAYQRIRVRFAVVRGNYGYRHHGQSHRTKHHARLGYGQARLHQADSETQRTTRPGVFAGGDIVTGAATVILAMGAGRRAASSIHDYLTNGQW